MPLNTLSGPWSIQNVLPESEAGLGTLRTGAEMHSLPTPLGAPLLLPVLAVARSPPLGEGCPWLGCLSFQRKRTISYSPSKSQMPRVQEARTPAGLLRRSYHSSAFQPALPSPPVTAQPTFD